MRKKRFAILLLVLSLIVTGGCSPKETANDEIKVVNIDQISAPPVKYSKYDASGINSVAPESDGNMPEIKKLADDVNRDYFTIDSNDPDKSYDNISKYLAKGVVYDPYARGNLYKKNNVKMNYIRTDIVEVNYDSNNDKYMVTAYVYVYVDNYDKLNGEKQIFKTDEYLVMTKEDSSFKVYQYYIFDELTKAGEKNTPYVVSTGRGNFYGSEDYKDIKDAEKLVREYAGIIYYQDYTDKNYKSKFSRILEYYSSGLKSKNTKIVDDRVKSQLENKTIQNMDKIDIVKVIYYENDNKYKIMAKAYVNLSQQKYNSEDKLYEEKYIQYFYCDIINENGDLKLSELHGLVNLVYSQKNKK